MPEQATNKLGSPWIHLLIAVLVTPFTGYAIFWGSLFGIAKLDEGWRPAWWGNSSNAEIVVLNSDQSPEEFSVQLIPVSTAATYAAEHRGSTFLIPIERKEQVRERLKNDLKLSWTTFEINKVADGQEEITLYFTDRADDSHGSRYKASKDSVRLESYRYISDRGAMGIVLLAMFVTFFTHIFVLGFLLIRALYIWRRKQRLEKAVVSQA
jgi:hypothetical protein